MFFTPARWSKSLFEVSSVADIQVKQNILAFTPIEVFDELDGLAHLRTVPRRITPFNGVIEESQVVGEIIALVCCVGLRVTMRVVTADKRAAQIQLLLKTYQGRLGTVSEYDPGSLSRS